MKSIRRVTTFAALLIGVSLVSVQTGSAQLGNGPKTVSAGPSGPASASGPVGPGLSRLPTTSPTVMPYLSSGGTPAAGEKSGSSTDTGVGSDAYGTNTSYKWPYTIARVAVTGAPYNTTNGAIVPVASLPSVSYTHLDVYKRQRLRTATSSARSSR